MGCIRAEYDGHVLNRLYYLRTRLLMEMGQRRSAPSDLLLGDWGFYVHLVSFASVVCICVRAGANGEWREDGRLSNQIKYA